MSKKALKKQAKAAEKAAKKDEKKENVQQQGQGSEEDVSVGKYGNLPIIQSTEKPTDRKLLHINDIGADLVEKNIWLRGRLHTSRAKGKQCFFVLRQQQFTVQCLLMGSATVSKQMIKFVAAISKESIVDLEGTVKSVPSPVEGCTMKDFELHVTQVFCVSGAEQRLPLQIEDASRPVVEVSTPNELNRY